MNNAKPILGEETIFGRLYYQDTDYAALEAENAQLVREAKNDAIAYKAAIERQDELRTERDALVAQLANPEAVFVNMKRGAIAKPSLRSMIDLYGEVVNGDEAQLLEIARLRAELASIKSETEQ